MLALYDGVADNWARQGPLLHDDLVGRPVVLAKARELASGGIVLDLGCGDANICRAISPFVRRTIGVDVSCRMLAAARRLCKGYANIELLEGNILDCGSLFAPASVDLVLALYVLCCLRTETELRQASSGVFRVLRPGGSLIVQVPHPLDSFLREPPAWWRDLDPPRSYFEEGGMVRRMLRTLDDRWLEVARYHHTTGTYFGALTSSGFYVTEILEPWPARELVGRDRRFSRDTRVPYTLIFIARKALT